MTKYLVTDTHVGIRLDVALADLLRVSRAQGQKLITKGAVLLNNERPKAHVILKKGDRIDLPELAIPLPTQKKAHAPILSVLYEDDDVLVIDKPAGLLVHTTGAADDHELTVVDALLERAPQTIDVGENAARPGIVHRLDRDVSGVMVIAKTQSAYDFLKEQFKAHTLTKEYVALVYGKISKDNGKIDLKIARSKTKGKMVARPASQDGKEALTSYDVVTRFKTVTLVHVTLHTGRTHQIRVHFRAIDHPLVGDRLYRKSSMRHIRPIELDRIFLHAKRLTLTLPNGKRRVFEAHMPNELTKLLQTLPK